MPDTKEHVIDLTDLLVQDHAPLRAVDIHSLTFDNRNLTITIEGVWPSPDDERDDAMRVWICRRS